MVFMLLLLFGVEDKQKGEMPKQKCILSPLCSFDNNPMYDYRPTRMMIDPHDYAYYYNGVGWVFYNLFAA